MPLAMPGLTMGSSDRPLRASFVVFVASWLVRIWEPPCQNGPVTPKPPVIVLDLFAEERRHLLSLLDGLTAEQWHAPTVCPGWSVKDLAAHLLGDDVNRIAGGRDGYQPSGLAGPLAWDELVAFLNHRNEEWVVALRRLSPRLLVELLDSSGDRVEAYFRSLDPMEPGDPVDWAGPGPAPRWLDIGREYTERWVHQEQIRDAIGAVGLRDPRLFHPVLDVFVHALPHAYRDVAAAEGTHVELVITGVAGGSWSLVRHRRRWGLFAGVDAPRASIVTLDPDTAWRLFTKGVDAATARRRVIIEGDRDLGAVALGAVAIIA